MIEWNNNYRYTTPESLIESIIVHMLYRVMSVEMTTTKEQRLNPLNNVIPSNQCNYMMYIDYNYHQRHLFMSISIKISSWSWLWITLSSKYEYPSEWGLVEHNIYRPIQSKSSYNCMMPKFVRCGQSLRRD